MAAFFRHLDAILPWGGLERVIFHNCGPDFSSLLPRMRRTMNATLGFDNPATLRSESRPPSVLPLRIETDIQMPIIDGYEATRQIKADPNLASVPLVAVSSFAMKGDEERRGQQAATTT